MENDNYCPDCGNLILRDKKNELVCKCGFVLGNYTPSPSTGKKTELGSVVDGVGPQDWKNVTSFDERLKDLHANISFNQNLEDRINDIMRTYKPEDASDCIVQSATELFKRAKNDGMARGIPIKYLATAIYYIAYAQHDTPKSLERITKSCLGSNVGPKDIRRVGRTYKNIKEKLKLKISGYSPENYISVICSDLNLSLNVRNKALDILKEARNKNLDSGCSPRGIAAATVYIASILNNEYKRQRDLANSVTVTEVTIRNTYRKFVDKLGIQLPNTESPSEP